MYAGSEQGHEHVIWNRFIVPCSSFALFKEISTVPHLPEFFATQHNLHELAVVDEAPSSTLFAVEDGATHQPLSVEISPQESPAWWKSPPRYMDYTTRLSHRW